MEFHALWLLRVKYCSVSFLVVANCGPRRLVVRQLTAIFCSGVQDRSLVGAWCLALGLRGTCPLKTV